MAVLYQKYRPQKFSEVFGQNNIRVTLQNEVLHNKTSHAYLFCGPRAVGKTTLARILAKAVNCKDRKKEESEPCNKCDACVSIDNFSNLDVVEIDAASNTGVDNVRENIISLSRVISTNNKYKVFIIDEIHMLSLSAFNALLKTLEEPPTNVMFILCTTEVYKIPLTIISRCERFDFKKIGVKDMVLKLETIVKGEKIEVDREVLELISLKSDGHLRDAETLLDQIMSISDKKIDLSTANLVIPYNNIEENINLLKYLAKNEAMEAIKLVNDLLASGVNLKLFINDLIELLRKIILAKVNPSLSSNLGLDLSEKIEIKISELSSTFTLGALINLSQSLMADVKETGNSFIPQMPIEFTIIKFCQSGVNDLSGVEKKTSKKEPGISKDRVSVGDNKKIDNTEQLLEIKNENLKNDNLGLDKVMDLWPEFLMKLKPHNHSLSFVMQSCRVNSVNGNKICLSFRYKLHKDRLDNPEIKNIIKKTLKDVYNNSLDIETSVDENLKVNNPSKSNDTVDDLLKTFGGQVIN